MDLTNGLLDAACNLADAEKKQGEGKNRNELPEFEALESKLNAVDGDDDGDGEKGEDDGESLLVKSSLGSNVSFFAWFGYRGREISAEQSEQARKADDEKWAKIASGQEVEDDVADDDDEDDEIENEELDELEDVEIFPDGENLAIALAEDLWPGALKYYGKFFFFLSDHSLTFDSPSARDG